jgi:hypothetical protein
LPLFLDEHPDPINDGYFINNPVAKALVDLVASYPNGVGGFSFADGHSEIKRWTNGTSTYPVQYAFFPPKQPFDGLGWTDFQWYRDRTGYVNAETGRGESGHE